MDAEFQATHDFLAEELWGNLEEPFNVSTASINTTSSTTSKRARRSTPKQQINRLQDEVRQLSAQFHSLKSTRPRPQSQHSKIWHEIALRQLERRRNSEKENVKLREMAKLQIEEAQNLRRLLQRRTRLQRLEEMVGRQLKRRENTRSLGAMQDDEQAFEGMLHHVDELYKTKTKWLVEKMHNIPCPGRKCHTDNTVINGVCFELTQRQVVPFSVEMVEDAVWRSLRQLELQGLRSAGNFEARAEFCAQNSEGDTTTTMVSFFADSSSKHTVGVKVRKVVRRYDEASRTVFIYQAFMEPKFDGLAVGVHATSSLLIALQHGGLNSESTQFESHFSASRHDEGLAAGSRLRLDVNLNIAIAVWGESIERIHDQVEKCLVDKAASITQRREG